MAKKLLTDQEYLHKILLSRIYEVARVTPLHKLDKLSERRIEWRLLSENSFF